MHFVLEAPNQHSEGLLVHVLMALNNLSYYDDPQSYIIRNGETLAQCKSIREIVEKRVYLIFDVVVLVKYIRNEEKTDCVIEAFRVLGNLSRAKKIRDLLVKCQGKINILLSILTRRQLFLVDQFAIHHCRSDNVELLYAVIGVLINLTVDEDKRLCLKIYDGIDR